MQPYFFSLVTKGNIENIKEFLSFNKDFDVNIKDETGRTALFTAHDLETIKYLMKNGADIKCYDHENFLPMAYYCEDHQHDIVKFFIENGSDINTKFDHECNTALMYASSKGDIEMVKFLFSSPSGQKINVNAKNIDNETALFNVSDLEIVKILIANGIDIDVVNSQGKTALDCAISNKHDKIVEYIKSKEKSCLTIISENKETKTVTISIKEGYALVIKN